MKKIAIIGMSGRFPGAANLQEFWHNIQNGVESISTIDEADLIKNKVPEEERKDPLYVRAAPILEDFDLFDARFFGINPREANLLDPQHRHFLEQTYLTLEDAGYAHPSKSQRISLFAGQGTALACYALEAFERMPEIRGKAPGFVSYCVSNDFFATRASYKMNLTGPAMDVQTACSSSLVATHLAVNSILEGSADMALAGGVTIRTPHKVGRLHEPGGIFSADGHCRPFDANGTGTLFGSGIGLVLLKDYETAVRDNDRIYASILATAINNDGSSKQSFPAPSTEGQLPCMHRCIELADIDPTTIQFVEAHGTATAVGDATELATLTQMLNPSGKDVDKTIALGSVKANIGHLSSASGVASLIKMALSLYHKKIPPQINFHKPNKKLSASANPCYVNNTLKDWTQGIDNKPRRGSVDSFGVGGTNAIAILEEHIAVDEQKDSSTASHDRVLPFVLTAKSAFSLDEMRKNLAKFVEENHALNLEQLSYNLCKHREFFDKRLSVFARDKENLASTLRDTAIETSVGTDGLWCYMFSGQGSQYSGMTKKLYDALPVYKKYFDQCDEILKGFYQEDLKALIFVDQQNKLTNTRYTQLALFVTEYCLYKSLENYGLKPNYMMGHSFGEYVAATISGCMTLEEGLRFIAKRGELIAALPSGGGMLAVKLDSTSVETLLEEYLKDKPEALLEFGGFNSPEQTVLTGNKADLEQFIPHLKNKNIDHKLLDVSHAFHSSLLDPALDDLREEAAKINWRKGSIPIVSNLNGELIQEYNADYWVAHARKPVQFQASIETLEKLDCRNFLEIGPRSVLLASVINCLQQPERASSIPLLRKGLDDELMFYNALGKIVDCGQKLTWDNFYHNAPHKKMSLPAYVFDRKRYWLPEPAGNTLFSAPQKEKVHPLLGYRIEHARGEVIFENEFRLDKQPHLRGHQIFQHVLFPMVGFVDLMAAASRELFQSYTFSLRNLKIVKGLALFEDKRVCTQVIANKTDEGYDIAIYSRKEGDTAWNTHILGQLRQDVVNPASYYTFPDSNPELPLHEIGAEHYSLLHGAGYYYGEEFSLLRAAKKVDGGFVGLLRADAEKERYIRDAGLLESPAHLKAFGASPSDFPAESIHLPVAIEHVDFFKEFPTEVLAARMRLGETDAVLGQGYWTKDGECLAYFSRLQRKELPKTVLMEAFSDNEPSATKHNNHAIRQWRYCEDWQEKNLSSDQHKNDDKPWLVIVSDSLKYQFDDNAFECIMPSSLDIALNNIDSNAKKINSYAGVINATPLSTDKDDITAKKQYEIYQAITNKVENQSLRLWTLSPTLIDTSLPDDNAFMPGFLRTLRVEQEGWFIGQIQLDDFTDNVGSLIHNILPQTDLEWLYRDKKWHVNRILPRPEFEQLHQRLTIPNAKNWTLKKGENEKGIAHLTLTSCDENSLKPNEIEVQVSHVGINFRDVLNAMELYPGAAIPLGADCSGVVLRVGSDVTKHRVGDEVFGLAPGCFAKTVVIDEKRMFAKPSSLTSAEASTIPVAYITAYYCLIQRAQIKKGDCVLIHTASGGLGLAAIQIARDVGCEIYATAGTEKKRAYLSSLGIDHIFDSRDRNFAAQIGTNKINAVINTLTGEGFIESTVSTCAENAYFIEVSKRNIWSDTEMEKARPDIKYCIVDYYNNIYGTQDGLETMDIVLSKAFNEKRYQALPAKIYPISQLPEAFHFMRETKHIGKLVIELPKDWRVSLASGHYLITGGLGGVGLELAAWLVGLGARHIVLTSRSKPNDASQQKINALQKQGVEVSVENVDVNNKESLARLVNSFPEGKLKGIIHAAGILHNERFQTCSWEDYAKVFQPKVEGSLNLHEAIYPIREQLDFLVYFSSTAAIFGGHGRTSYAGANGFLNQLTRYQRQLGIPAVATCWGAWDEVGMAMPYRERMISRGTNLMKPSDACNEIEDILDQGENLAVISNINWPLYTKISVPNDSRFANLKTHTAPVTNDLSSAKAQTDPSTTSTEVTLNSRLSTAADHERKILLLEYLEKALRSVLGVSANENIDRHIELNGLGLDSLAAVEFLAKINKGIELNSAISTDDLAEFATLDKLSTRLLQLVKLTTVQSDSTASDVTSPAAKIKSPLTARPNTSIVSAQKNSDKNTADTEELAQSPHFNDSTKGTSLWQPLPQDLELSWLLQFFRKPSTISAYWDCPVSMDPNLLEQAINRVLQKHPLFFIKVSKTSPKFRNGEFKPVRLLIKDYSHKQDNRYEESKDLFNQRIRFELRKVSESENILVIIADHLFADGLAFIYLRQAINQEYLNLKSAQPPEAYNPNSDFLHNFPDWEAEYIRESTFLTRDFELHQKAYLPFKLSDSQESKQDKSQKNWLKHLVKLEASDCKRFTQRCLERGLSSSDVIAAFAANSYGKAIGQYNCSVLITDSGRAHLNHHEIIARCVKFYALNFKLDSESDQVTLLKQISEQISCAKKLIKLPFLASFFYRKSRTVVGKIILENFCKLLARLFGVNNTIAKSLIPRMISSELEQKLGINRLFSTPKVEHLIINHLAAAQKNTAKSDTELTSGHVIGTYNSPTIDNATMFTTFINDDQWCLLWRSTYLNDELQRKILQDLVEEIQKFIAQ